MRQDQKFWSWFLIYYTLLAERMCTYFLCKFDFLKIFIYIKNIFCDHHRNLEHGSVRRCANLNEKPCYQLTMEAWTKLLVVKYCVKKRHNLLQFTLSLLNNWKKIIGVLLKGTGTYCMIYQYIYTVTVLIIFFFHIFFGTSDIMLDLRISSHM